MSHETTTSPQSEQRPIRVDLKPAQKRNLDMLRRNFGLSDEELNRCLFFRPEQDEPWMPPKILEAIARQVGNFQQLTARYDKFEPALDQVIWEAMLIDERGRTYIRSGIATRGEAPAGAEIDPHVLAEGRALSAVLSAGGYNPFNPMSIKQLTVGERKPGEPTITERAIKRGILSEQPKRLTDEEIELQRRADEAELRGKDLRQIHALAAEKGLIIGRDDRPYRRWLMDKFGTTSCVFLEAEHRAQVINKLRTDFDGDVKDWSHLGGLSEDVHEEALIA